MADESPSAEAPDAEAVVVAELVETGAVDPIVEPPPVSATPPKRPSRLAVILLSVALGLTVVAVAALITLLVLASERIDQQEQKIEEQEQLIEQKETFGAAMSKLMDTARTFEGALMGALVPVDEYSRLADLAWTHRWTSAALDRDTQRIEQEQVKLEALRADADARLAGNDSGSTYEKVIDKLGAGFVTSSLDKADSICGDDVLACVMWDDPYVIHFDKADAQLPYMTSWLETGLAYHEFAHVLQATNPEQTEVALTAFDGDHETMADCYALTYLPGWTLDHTVWVSSFEYYEVSIGYGHTCTSSQRAVVREWYESLGVVIEPITQQ